MSVTLKEIAKKANVSISTVSRIVNNDKLKPASQETQEKVWRIIHETGYIPNQNARKLVKNQTCFDRSATTKAIGCIFASTDKNTFNDPFFSLVTRGIQLETGKNGYVLGYSFSSSDLSQAALFNNITSHPVDGILILGRYSDDVLKFLRNNFKNLIYSGLNYINGGFDEVICDSFKAAECAVGHLIKLGHRRIGYLGAIPQTELHNVVNEHRYEGYLAALAKHQIQVDLTLVKNIWLSTKAAYLGMKELLKEKRIPTALFCANDLAAIGAMKAICEAGLLIPKDIAVVGIEDIEMAAYVEPALTTIRVPKEELGRLAVKVLVDRIEGGHELPIRVDVPFELVIRESCGGKVE
jgi:DNA-binding LacI/PurR family transcriptional regulator